LIKRRTRLEQSSQFEALIKFGALGLAGRYLGGQASQQGQRFWARGEDPDQFAGWFGQSIETSRHPLLVQRLCRRKEYLETIEVVDPMCSGDLFDQN